MKNQSNREKVGSMDESDIKELTESGAKQLIREPSSRLQGLIDRSEKRSEKFINPKVNQGRTSRRDSTDSSISSGNESDIESDIEELAEVVAKDGSKKKHNELIDTARVVSNTLIKVLKEAEKTGQKQLDSNKDSAAAQAVNKPSAAKEGLGLNEIPKDLDKQLDDVLEELTKITESRAVPDGLGKMLEEPSRPSPAQSERVKFTLPTEQTQEELNVDVVKGSAKSMNQSKPAGPSKEHPIIAGAREVSDALGKMLEEASSPSTDPSEGVKKDLEELKKLGIVSQRLKELGESKAKEGLRLNAIPKIALSESETIPYPRAESAELLNEAGKGPIEKSHGPSYRDSSTGGVSADMNSGLDPSGFSVDIQQGTGGTTTTTTTRTTSNTQGPDAERTDLEKEIQRLRDALEKIRQSGLGQDPDELSRIRQGLDALRRKQEEQEPKKQEASPTQAPPQLPEKQKGMSWGAKIGQPIGRAFAQAATSKFAIGFLAVAGVATLFTGGAAAPLLGLAVVAFIGRKSTQDIGGELGAGTGDVVGKIIKSPVTLAKYLMSKKQTQSEPEKQPVTEVPTSTKPRDVNTLDINATLDSLQKDLQALEQQSRSNNKALDRALEGTSRSLSELEMKEAMRNTIKAAGSVLTQEVKEVKEERTSTGTTPHTVRVETIKQQSSGAAR